MRSPPCSALIFKFSTALARSRSRASNFIKKLSSEEKSALLEESQRYNFESLMEKVLGTAETASLARQRIERFRFACHRRMTAVLAEALEKKRVPVIVLKGVPLAERLYDFDGISPWMRPVGDIDLFVHPASVLDAAEILSEEMELRPREPIGRGRNNIRHTIDFLPSGTIGIGQFSVELHAHISHSPWRENLEFSDLFNRALPWKRTGYSGDGIRQLSPLDETVYLASHGAGHRFEQPKWLLDLARSIRCSEAETKPFELLNRARECRCRSALLLSLKLLQNSGAEVPSSLWGGKNQFGDAIRKFLFFTSMKSAAANHDFLRGAMTCLSLIDKMEVKTFTGLGALLSEKIHRQSQGT